MLKHCPIKQLCYICMTETRSKSMIAQNTERDNQLLDRLKAGDEEALKEIFDIYYKPLCIYSVQFTEQEQESEDIVQDLFIRIWEKHLYRQITQLGMYLFFAVRNQSMAYARKHEQYEDIEDLEKDLYTEWNDDFSEEEINQKRRQLHDTLKKLSPKEYAILTEIIVNSKPYKQVAQEMDISVNTVKTHLRRAMKVLREEKTLVFLPFF